MTDGNVDWIIAVVVIFTLFGSALLGFIRANTNRNGNGRGDGGSVPASCPADEEACRTGDIGHAEGTRREGSDDAVGRGEYEEPPAYECRRCAEGRGKVEGLPRYEEAPTYGVQTFPEGFLP